MKKLLVAAATTIALACPAETMVSWIATNSHHRVDAPTAARYLEAARASGKRYGVDPTLIVAVMRKETGFRTAAVSKEGARGVMQVIPKWHPEKMKGRNVESIEGGTDIGTKVLAEYIVWAKGDVKKALRRYSGGSKKYAEEVLAIRAILILTTTDARSVTIAINSPSVGVK